MGLTNQEKINFNSKVLAANVQDGTPSKQWYESIRPNFFILEDNQVLTEFDTVRANPAANLATARSNCTGALSGIVVDLSQPASAVRLTEDIAANGFQYIALSIYNDFSSSRLDKWIQPQKVPQTNGQPSIGYSIQLYDGDPNSGGTLINTSDGQTGAGNTASPGWIFNYDTGTLLLSEDFKSTISDPYIVGFRYIGKTVALFDGGLGGVSFTFARKGRARNIYLPLGDGQSSMINGILLPRNATILAVVADSEGFQDWTLEIRKNGGTMSLFDLAATGGNGYTQNANVDLDQGDRLQVFCNTTNFLGVKHPIAWIEIVWRI